MLLAGWLVVASGRAEERRVDTTRPAPSPVEKTAAAWEEKFAQENYVPAGALEKSYREYLKRLTKACGMAAGGDMADVSRIVGRARQEMTADTERLIQAFVDAGYLRADAEVYFDRLFASLQRELALYYGNERRRSIYQAKSANSTVSDELLAKAQDLYGVKKDLVGALKALDDALRFAPDNTRLILDTALRQQAAGQLAEARANFDLAREHYPKVVSIYIGMGDIRLAAKDYLGAIEALTTAICLEPGALVAYSMRGVARQALEDYEGAIDDYSLQLATGMRVGKGGVLLRRGSAHEELGRTEIARADYRESIRLEPNNPAAHLMLARLLSHEGKNPEALAALNKSVELRPNWPGGYATRVWVLLAMGQNENASRDADRLVELAPEDSHIALIRAVVLDLIDRSKDAESGYRQSLDLARRKGENERWYYANLQLDMFLRRQGRPDPGYLHDVLDWPDDWPKRIALYLTGRVTAESLLQAARQAPTRQQRLNHECEANFYVGMALWSAGNHQAAEPYLRAAARPEYSGNLEHDLVFGLLQKPAFSTTIPGTRQEAPPPVVAKPAP